MSHDLVNELVRTKTKAVDDATPVAAAVVEKREAGTNAVSALEAASQTDVPFEYRMATKNDLAAFFKVEVRTIENWQRNRLIPFVKIGGIVRFKMGDVVRHVAKHFTFAASHS